MLNNQIIVTDDTLDAYARRNEQGIVDATKLTDDEWAQLCARNVNSTRARIVKCGFCWVDHGEIQWMQTFTNHLGKRVIRHQPGEAQDHPYQRVETPRHKGYKERAYRVGDREGLESGIEVPAEDGKTIADSLIKGVVPLDYEHQHSDFSRDRSLATRIGLIAASGRVPMFHTDQPSIFNKQRAPILRTDGDVPLEWITDLNRPLAITGGLREIIVFTCDARNGVYCPKGRISGCGKTHARTEPLIGVALDEALIHGAMDEYRYLFNAQVTELPKSFWTDRKSYDRYMSALGGDGKLAPLEGAPVDKAKTRNGTRSGHSSRKEAELEAMRARAVDLSALATPAPERIEVCGAATTPISAPALPLLPTVRELGAKQQCAHWQGAWGQYCMAPATRYVIGWRCPDHTPARIAGRPEPQPGPGWPVHRSAS